MPAAFVTSLLLHGAVVALMFLVAYSTRFETPPVTKAFELVAGEGDNFAATEAPAFGTPGGIKLNVPTPPTPRPEPAKPEVIKPEPEPAPEPPEPTPVAPTPPAPKPPPATKPEPAKTAPTTKSAPTKTKTIAEQMRWEAIKEESKAKLRAAREKAAEKKRLEKARAEQARLAKAAAANAPKVDVDGIVNGVKNGSTTNKINGASGTALTRSDGPAMEAYFAMLKDRLLKALDKPPGLSDTLVAEAEFRIGADGSISAVKIITPSGSAEFDRAVLDAYSRVRMPARPDGKSSVQTARFRTKDLEGG